MRNVRNKREGETMSGLERLRELIQKQWPLPEWRDKSKFANELREIADEIESEMEENSFYASFERFAKSIGKPIEESPILNIRKWLDYWYLPRPVIDGEPVQFGDRLKNKPLDVVNISTSKFKVDEIQFTDFGSVFVNGFVQSSLKRVKPDSIEKLKREMVSITYTGAYGKEEAEELVNEWLSRAEKLFKDGENDK